MHDAFADTPLSVRRDGSPRAIPLGQGDIAAYEWGPADRPVDVIWHHATGFNARTYRQMLARLGEAGLRVLAFDARGHGRTRLPAEPRALTSWKVFVRDLGAVLDFAAQRKVVLAGHSFGAAAAIMAAAQRPERVRALVLFDPVLMPPVTVALGRLPGGGRLLMRRAPIAVAALKRQRFFASREEALARYAAKSVFASWAPGVLEDYLLDGLVAVDGGVALSCQPEWEAAVFATGATDVLGRLDGWSLPGRALLAERGSTLRRRGALQRAFPSMRIEKVAGSSHFLPMERPGLCAEALAQQASQE